MSKTSADYMDKLRGDIENHNMNAPFTISIPEYYQYIDKVPEDDLHLGLICALTNAFPLLMINVDGDEITLSFIE